MAAPPEIVAQIPAMVQQLLLPNTSAQLAAVTNLRKFTSSEQPPIREVLEAGAAPHLVHLLAQEQDIKLLFEALWLTTNLLSGGEAEATVLVEQGVVPFVVKLLRFHDKDVREQAVWTVGNLVGQSALCRDFVWTHGGLQALVLTAAEAVEVNLQRNCSWALSNFVRGKPVPVLELACAAVPVMASFLFKDDEEVVVDAVWGLSYVAEMGTEAAKVVMDAGTCPCLVEILKQGAPLNVVTPALKALAAIAACSDSCRAVVALGALQALPALLTHSKKALRKESCKLMAKLVEGGQARAVVGGRAMAELVEIARVNAYDESVEAAQVVCAVLCCGEAEVVATAVTDGAFRAVARLLNGPDPKLVVRLLAALDCVLKMGAGRVPNPYADALEKVDALNQIEALQCHANQDVYMAAVNILEAHFMMPDEELSGCESEPLMEQEGAGFSVPPLSVSGRTRQQMSRLAELQLQPPQVVLESLPHLLTTLQAPGEETLAVQAARIISNLAWAGEEPAKELVEKGAMSALGELLQRPGKELREQALQALRGIASHSAELCRTVQRLVKPVCGLLFSEDVEAAVRLLRLLCQGPKLVLEQLEVVASALTGALQFGGEALATEACWALCSLLETGSDLLFLLHGGGCRRLLELLQQPTVRTAALAALQRLAHAGEAYRRFMLANGLLTQLGPLLQCGEACGVVSGLCAGGPDFVEEVLAAGLLPPLLRCPDGGVAVSAAFVHASALQVLRMDQEGAVEPLVSLLGSHNVEVRRAALGAVERLLGLGGSDSAWPARLRRAGAAQQLVMLQQDEGLRQQASLLHSHYFGDLESWVLLPEQIAKMELEDDF